MLLYEGEILCSWETKFELKNKKQKIESKRVVMMSNLKQHKLTKPTTQNLFPKSSKPFLNTAETTPRASKMIFSAKNNL